jgi:hypothetical protein
VFEEWKGGGERGERAPERQQTQESRILAVETKKLKIKFP